MYNKAFKYVRLLTGRLRRRSTKKKLDRQAMRDNIEQVLESADLAQELILQLHAQDPEHETFEQLGLLDGEDTVMDHIDHGDLGCALHHLLYMVHEADIPFPRDMVLNLHRMAIQIGEHNHYSKENQVNLTTDQLSAGYNDPP